MRKKVDAKNDLENTCYSIKNQFENNEEVNSKLKEIAQWIENHQNEEPELYEEKKKDLIDFVSSQTPEPSSNSEQSNNRTNEPNIQEVD